MWAEGPAWNGVGRYLVWSDIPNNVQMRWIEDDGRVTVFRNPSGYSNGNTFDYEGRQLSCEHGGRRVVRYEPTGPSRSSRTSSRAAPELAQRRRRASGRRHLVHRSDLRHSRQLRRVQGGIGNQGGGLPRRPGDRARSVKVTDDATGPNGLCFSPDYRKLYVADTGTGREIRAYDVDGTSLRNGRRLAQLTMPGSPGALSSADGIRCDVDGNIWAGARPGVQVIAPDGALIGMIRLPGELRERLLRRDASATACS